MSLPFHVQRVQPSLSSQTIVEWMNKHFSFHSSISCFIKWYHTPKWHTMRYKNVSRQKSSLGKAIFRQLVQWALGFYRKRGRQCSNLDCCSREEKPVARVYWVEAVLQNDLSVGRIDEQDVIQGPAGFVHLTHTQAVLFPLELHVLPFGVLRKVEDVDDGAHVGRGSGTSGEKGGQACRLRPRPRDECVMLVRYRRNASPCSNRQCLLLVTVFPLKRALCSNKPGEGRWQREWHKLLSQYERSQVVSRRILAHSRDPVKSVIW